MYVYTIYILYYMAIKGNMMKPQSKRFTNSVTVVVSFNIKTNLNCGIKFWAQAKPKDLRLLTS